MRLLPSLAAMLLISTALCAQPAYPPQPDMQPPPYGQNQQGGPMQGGPMQGGGPGRMNMVQKFEAANTTHDGRLTRDQAQAGGLMNIARNFDQIDSDRKGYVTKQDIRAWRIARRQARGPQSQQSDQQPPNQNQSPNQYQSPNQEQPPNQEQSPDEQQPPDQQ